jgi:acetylornithine deacetylase/succinyl-diaminopimelate desuccinylase-like protein
MIYFGPVAKTVSARCRARSIASIALRPGGRLSDNSRRFEHVRRIARESLPRAVELTIRIAETPAPTGQEGERAKVVSELLCERGYAAEIDDVGNVFARRGSRGGACLLLAAHIDTVFPLGTDVTVVRNGETLRGPGVGDNSLGVASLLVTLDALDRAGISTASDIVAVATVGEEGLGNLVGIKAAMQRFQSDAVAVIAVEGHNLGRVTHTAVGSRRWRITVRGPGGHSWGAFGQPSAIHGLARIVTEIGRVPVPSEPKTTFNVGVIEGGVSINTIAPEASALLDMRSVDHTALANLAQHVTKIINLPLEVGLGASIAELGERPAGFVRRDDPLVMRAGEILSELGIEAVFDASSTDANVPISMGVPAICIGITRGGLGHTTDEFIHVPPIADGLAQLIMLSIDATTMIASREPNGAGRA